MIDEKKLILEGILRHYSENGLRIKSSPGNGVLIYDEESGREFEVHQAAQVLMNGIRLSHAYDLYFLAGDFKVLFGRNPPETSGEIRQLLSSKS